MKKRRKYRLKKRAESQARTRERIVEATIALHQTLGVKFTTISAIAREADVERLTVYRHFPDESALLRACSGRWLELHPLPDPAQWQDIADPIRRTRLALNSLYSYHRRTEKMWIPSYRDEPEVPALEAVMRKVRAYLHQIVRDLASAWGAPPRATAVLRAALAHSVQFSTWLSLKNEKLEDAEIAEIMILWFRTIRNHGKVRVKKLRTRSRIRADDRVALA